MIYMAIGISSDEDAIGTYGKEVYVGMGKIHVKQESGLINKDTIQLSHSILRLIRRIADHFPTVCKMILAVGKANFL